MDMGAEETRTRKADSRGRINLGTEYSEKRVTVEIVDVESADWPDDDELAAAYRDASESATELANEMDSASAEAWERLE